MTDRVRTQVTLASASPARLATLRAAGLDPQVVVSGYDESLATADTPAGLAQELAEAKAALVITQVPVRQPNLVIGCDSVLEFEGEVFGKPHTAEVAVRRWRRMRGRTGILHTGHAVLHHTGEPRDGWRPAFRAAATTVSFADLDDAEIDAYVATGEPLEVAGAFTLDGLGGAFVTGIEGDPHNVVGISLPLLRELIMELGLSWPDLWRR